MSTELDSWFEAAVAPQPVPPGASSRDIVWKAIEFAGPPRIPYSFVEPLRSDFFELAELERILDRAGAASRRSLGDAYRDEWGVCHEVAEGLFDRVVDHPLSDLARLGAHRFPDVGAAERFERVLPFVRRAHRAGKYVVAGDPVLLFERLRSLLGFEALMLAPYQQREGFESLLDRLADLTVESVRGFARLGEVDGFMTWQDFGLQTRLAFSLETFREYYAPRLARVVRAVHDVGMHFIWHCCGQIFDLIPEMIAMGVDVVQIDQPRLLGHRRMADVFGGRICFWNTVDTQWCTKSNLTDEDLRAEVAAMMEPFRRFRGGFMVRHYPQPRDIGLSRHFHEVTAGAFLAGADRRAGV
jgi:uroporphyrinogen decarboxylase